MSTHSVQLHPSFEGDFFRAMATQRSHRNLAGMARAMTGRVAQDLERDGYRLVFGNAVIRARRQLRWPEPPKRYVMASVQFHNGKATYYLIYMRKEPKKQVEQPDTLTAPFPW